MSYWIAPSLAKKTSTNINIENVIHCEIDAELSKIVKYNYNKLQINNIDTVAQNGLGITFIKKF